MALGSLLCRVLDARPVLANVHPAAYQYSSRGHMDPEWARALYDHSGEILDEAKVEFERRHGWTDVATAIAGHRSSGQGLSMVAEDRGSDMIVIGSAPNASPGRFAIGSTADKLLHGSHVPVAVAPAGYRKVQPEGVGRMVVAFQNSDGSKHALAEGTKLAESAGTGLGILTVLIRNRVFGTSLGGRTEGLVIDEMREDTQKAQEAALAGLPKDLDATASIVVGDTPLQAMQRVEWEGDEILVLGSARGGHIARVFLGDMTYKLLRATPVPAIILPRSRAHHDPVFEQ